MEPETDFTVPLGAGAIISTLVDLTKFADALFGGKLLKSETLELMMSVKGSYGMGLFPIPFYTSKGYGHTGGIDGFSSVYVNFPDDNISYALTSNGTNFNNNDITTAVLSAVYNNPYDIPVFTTYNVTSEDLDKYLGFYASKQIPLKITITKSANTLIAQATGQPAFSLDASANNKFRYDLAGIKLEFYPSDKKMMLFQGGGEFLFVRE